MENMIHVGVFKCFFFSFYSGCIVQFSGININILFILFTDPISQHLHCYDVHIFTYLLFGIFSIYIVLV